MNRSIQQIRKSASHDHNMIMASSSPEDNNKELNTNLTSEETGIEQGSTTTESENPIVTAGEAVADGKINLFLKATSDVPIMKKKKWQVDQNKTVHWVITFIKKYLKLEDKDIFLYVAQSFAPAPDQQIKNLYECFGAEGKLVLHYSKTPAWG